MFTNQEEETLKQYFKEAGLVPEDVSPLVNYFCVDYPKFAVNFQTINVATRELSPKLRWHKIPTPANEAVIVAWKDNECPKGLFEPGTNGLSEPNKRAIGEYITPHLGKGFTKAVLNEAVRVLSEQGRLAYFGKPAPTPEPAARQKTQKEISDAFSGQGTRYEEQTGRVNHAKSKTVEPATATVAQAATVELLTSLQKAGHTAFVKQENQRASEMLKSGKTPQQVFASVRENVTEYTATLAVANHLQHGGSGSAGKIAATRERFAGIVREGRKAGWSTSQIANLLQQESDGERTSFIGNGDNF